MYYTFSLKIWIPKKIISFNAESKYNKELNNSPNFLEKLYLPINYNKEIKNINSKCIVIIQKIEKNR